MIRRFRIEAGLRNAQVIELAIAQLAEAIDPITYAASRPTEPPSPARVTRRSPPPPPGGYPRDEDEPELDELLDDLGPTGEIADPLEEPPLSAGSSTAPTAESGSVVDPIVEAFGEWGEL